MRESLLPVAILGFVILLIFYILSIVISRMSPSHAFIRTKKRIRWVRVIKYWVIIQGLTILANYDDIWDKIYETILFPLFIMLFLILYAMSYTTTSGNGSNRTIINDNQKEFEEFEKSFIRNKKIKKLLK